MCKHDEHVILVGANSHPPRVQLVPSTVGRAGDQFRAPQCQEPGWLRQCPIEADHHADFYGTHLEDGVIFARQIVRRIDVVTLGKMRFSNTNGVRIMKRIIGLLILMCSSIAWAGNDTTQSVGFVTGSTHGLGVTYARQNNESGIGWQVSGLPIWSEDERHLSGGLAIFKTLNQGRKGRAFISFGVATNYHRSVIEKWDDSSSEPIGEEVDESEEAGV